MATNKRMRGNQDKTLAIACTHPATPAANDPVIAGRLPGVCLVDEDAAGISVISLEGVFALTVKAIDGSGNSAVATGDKIYYVSANTPPLSKVATGVPFGVAYRKDTGTREQGTLISAGATAVIQVAVGVPAD